ncbi:rhomboid family intramembrane serine protease [Naasia lichenicola]|uniref:rhomboid family intramembrane serine protease n=1 Tax=Naasia lichenicola TaxID=2565933 RepID=UPI001E5C48BB|nr:rhomboid family intramembrane serine protease [Naasia lichenicola]
MSNYGTGLAAGLRRLRRSVAPSASYAIITITLLVFLLQLIPGLGVTNALQYAGAYSIPAFGSFEPWRMITVSLVHSTSSPFHILFNMLFLWLMGRQVESLIGTGKFVALYLISTLGGSVAVLFLASPLQPVVGASGAIYGLLATFFVIARKSGGNTTGLVILIGINLVFSFVTASISWQAHVGGLITGGVVALILVQTPRRSQRNQQIALLAAVVGVLIVLTALRSVLTF